MFWLGFYFPELVKVIFLWYYFLSYSGVLLAVLNFVFSLFDACIELGVNPFLS